MLQYFTSAKLVDVGSLLLESCSTGCYDKSVLLQWVLQYFTSAAKLVDVGSLLLESCSTGCYNKSVLFQWVLQYFTVT